MQNVKINRDRVVFINLTEMNEYSGVEDNPKGGGTFIEQNGYGYEVFNFRKDGLKCYGFTPPYGKLNLLRISNEISRDDLGDYIDDVFVVFTCSRNSGGRLVCGFYQHARVYAATVDDNRSTRVINIDGKTIFITYNIICDVKNAILINREDRVQRLPRSSDNNGVGYGQHLVWYVDEPERQELKNKLLDYVESLINQANVSDEFKYHLHDEGKQLSYRQSKLIEAKQPKQSVFG